MSHDTFEAIQIGLASPELIRDVWSHGEVKKPETINYRTLKPERDGLFCERIFGPTKDWECHCGKYKKVRYKGKICDRCGVEVTRAKVRRERMGHIELAAPVSHIWYFRGTPSRLGLMLDMSPRLLEKVLYFANYIVIDPGDTPLVKYQILTEKEYRDMVERYEDDFRAGMGAEAIKELLQEIDVEQLCTELREELDASSGQKKMRIIKRLEVAESFRMSGNKPEWMILDVLPVIPPELRPMVQLDGGRFATSDLNDLYRRVINRNNRLRRLLQLEAPDIIVRNEKRMLQEAVDSLIDNGRRGRSVTGPNNRALKSLSDLLKGKQGRFRQNLLGKRVDYSGRSVIVVGPELKIYQCGLPKEMAVELFKPFIMKKLVEDGVANNIKSAKKMVERTRNEVWDALEDIIKEHPVMLNRAPTLHRLGIQAFEPVLVEGRAIKLHPLVCTAFNADFDGDQMAIHVPLSAEAQAEARFLMLSANNLLRPQDGKPVTVPTQDMVLGSYYLTIDHAGEKGEGKIFADKNEALMAYDAGIVGIHAAIKVRVTREVNGEKITRIVPATVGRLIFNEVIPQDLGYVDRSDPEHVCDLEIGFMVRSRELSKIIERGISKHGFADSAVMLDNIKALGYKYSTKAAITISISDMVVPPEKWQIIGDTEKRVTDIEGEYEDGLITNEERRRLVISEWEKTTDDVTKAMQAHLTEMNPIYMMANSGARGNTNQVRQIAGMRGLMADTLGRTIEIPVRSNFREGLSVLEYFISSRSARKGGADTALRTADSGYLTRRLVDVSQDVIIREVDCGCHDGIVVREISEGGRVIESFGDRLRGRYLLEPIVHPETGEVLVPTDHMITDDDVEKVLAAGVTEAKIRSVLTCKARSGVCAKCYGSNLAYNQPANVGDAVGIIAAQSIGEPGTQLTMRTFHTGGVAGDDITQGLPRVAELFEARKPKRTAIMADASGIVRREEIRRAGQRMISITNPDDPNDVTHMSIPFGSVLKVHDGDVVEQGDELTDGALNPHDILRLKGVPAVHNYLIREVSKVYRQQGIDINDRHIEIIVRQMMRKLRVEDPGSTDLLMGTLVDVLEYDDVTEAAMKRCEANGEEFVPATVTPVLMGITKASLSTESFLSAASFQETTRVLTDAAIKGKIDHLSGLKENVIIGKLVPAGSGMEMYRDFNMEVDEPVRPEFADLVEQFRAAHGAADAAPIIGVTTTTQAVSEDESEDETEPEIEE